MSNQKYFVSKIIRISLLKQYLHFEQCYSSNNIHKNIWSLMIKYIILVYYGCYQDSLQLQFLQELFQMKPSQTDQIFGYWYDN